LVRAYDPLGITLNGAHVEVGASPVKGPLVKDRGEFVEVTWEQAVKYLASTLAHYQGDQFAALSSAKCTNEENYVFQKFVRSVMKTNNVDHCARL
jgi:formate dehydrogenase major subunit